MKGIDDLQTRVDELEGKVKLMREQQERLCEEVRQKTDLPFMLKFKIWSVCAKQKQHVCKLNSKKFPFTVKLLEKDGYIPGEQINIFDKWGLKFNLAIKGLISDEEEKTLIENVMLELFDANVGSLSVLK